ncbi:MAG: hypothetical protein JWO45_209 [Spartobacteria bacterium]|nr:hypothetical protein [Spartobacteria bacterium]
MFSTLEDAKSVLDQNNGVLTVKMAIVRDAHGAGRLGIHVRKNISDKLASLGVGHFPVELPENQDANVRLYCLGTPVAALIKAVLFPDAANDAKILDVVGGDAEKILIKIRDLVCP